MATLEPTVGVEPSANLEPPARMQNPPKMQPLRASMGSHLPPGPRLLVRKELAARQAATPQHSFPRRSNLRMTAFPRPLLLMLPHLGKSLHHLPPSWRSLQSQWAHGSLSWREEGTRDRSRAATGQGPSPASSPEVTPPATSSSNTGCWQVEKGAGQGEKKGLR